MSKFDVRARIVKTREERIYPEKVFEVLADDPENPLEFIEYVDIPTDTSPQPSFQQPAQTEVHSQLLIDEVIKLREENNRLKAAQEEKPKSKGK